MKTRVEREIAAALAPVTNSYFTKDDAIVLDVPHMSKRSESRAREAQLRQCGHTAAIFTHSLYWSIGD